MIDVEETCQDHNSPDYMPGVPMEIIQIGYCMIDMESLSIENPGCIYVKPTRSKVTEFCTQLTGITPKQASKGMTFHAACRNLERKLGSRRYAWAGWGEECNSFKRDCEFHHTIYPFNSTFVDLSVWFTFNFGLEPNQGLDFALKHFHFEFEGRRHDGQADAWNQARLLRSMILMARDSRNRYSIACQNLGKIHV